MKKYLFGLIFLVSFFLRPQPLQAATCSSATFSCVASNGQPALCPDTCDRVVVTPGICSCRDKNAAASIPLGGQCQQDSDCAAPGKYCWSDTPKSVPTCHIQSHAEATQFTTAGSKEVCNFAGNNTDCKDCFAGTGKYYPNPGTWTAIGCIPSDPQGFITKFLGFGVGVGGGIAFLLILFGGFQIMTSAGNPEKLNAGKELVGAAISGLLLIIFSLFLLKLIGYNILGIPDFG